VDHSQSAGAIAALGVMWLFITILIVAMIVFSVWVYWRILEKAGYTGALALLALIPVGSLILLLILAFGKWPIETQIEAMGAGPRPVSPTIGGPPMTT
jgi:hypothetical protein